MSTNFPYTPFHPGIEHSTLDELKNINLSADLDSILLEIRALFEFGKEYSMLAASILSEKIRIETTQTIHNVSEDISSKRESEKKHLHLIDFVDFGVENGHLNPKLKDFDLEFLDKHIDYERNYIFDYLGAHTLYDRYLLHVEGARYESFQHFWMRVAMGIALSEKTPKLGTEKALDFYNAMSQFYYIPSTPTLFNAGTNRPQMSSCFLTTTQDNLVDIYRQYSDNAMLSKYAGGIGNDWSNIRGSGSWIKGTNGRSQGVIPFIKVQDSSTIAVNQGGKRKGAVCAYLEVWHIDIEDFLELRKNTGDERRRTPDMNTATWIPDLFLKRVESDGQWTLFCPSESKNLHSLYGEDFEKLYCHYEDLAREGKVKNFKTVSALQLWRKLLTMLFETGHPWITFKDPCNLRSSQRHTGTVHSSNLCTEITLNTNSQETAVCNLGSINLKAIFQSQSPGDILKKTIKTAIRMLDNVISGSFYPIESAKNANQKHRPIGLGLMGFQDVLYKKRLPYSNPGAIYLSEEISKYINYYATLSSSELAKERGAYQSFEGSSWSKGQLTHDTMEFLGKHVNAPSVPKNYTNLDNETKPCSELLESDGIFTDDLDWNFLREKVKKGMRNSLCEAIAPTATISNIAGCCQSIEPSYKNLFVKSNMGGDYIVINEYLVKDLKKEGLWNKETSKQLKSSDGSVQSLPIPDHLKELYKIAFEIEPKHTITCAAVRQKYIDQAQSLNLYMAAPSGRKLDEMYRYAWHCGLKTTYYLRTKAATSVEKSSLRTNNTTNTQEPKMCSIEDPSCEACQ